jgi:hypothetical protein
MARKRNQRFTETTWKKLSLIVATLTAAVSLYQQAEHAVITTANDIAFFVTSQEPVTYAQLEARRLKPEW